MSNLRKVDFQSWLMKQFADFETEENNTITQIWNRSCPSDDFKVKK